MGMARGEGDASALRERRRVAGQYEPYVLYHLLNADALASYTLYCSSPSALLLSESSLAPVSHLDGKSA